jgi:RimJ/RimL family protein N-acetyltransferase
MGSDSWSPTKLVGERVVLRRHAPANVEAFRRWYGDPQVARLTRYQDGPMRPVEIERFFISRVMGPDSLALAIHVRASGRLVGTCAFSQLDADNGSALFHITIGEIDAWGRGYGTEATRLMLAHAFDTLRLHRIALSVFEFNQRAIRAYRRCGFRVEGRAREAIWRDGRRWDELNMSILADEWAALKSARRANGATRAIGRTPAGVRDRTPARAGDHLPSSASDRVAAATATGAPRD